LKDRSPQLTKEEHAVIAQQVQELVRSSYWKAVRRYVEHRREWWMRQTTKNNYQGAKRDGAMEELTVFLANPEMILLVRDLQKETLARRRLVPQKDGTERVSPIIERVLQDAEVG
jgi:hypothetical protein